MVIDIGSLSEAWRALTKTAAETEEAAYNRARRGFESLEIGVSESAAECFARVHVILMKLARHQVTTPAREIKRTVLGSLTSCFPDEVRLYAMKSETLDFTDLENGLTRAESFQLDQERRNTSAHALAVAHAGSGRTGARGGARGRGRQGRRPGKRHDDGQGRNQQKGIRNRCPLGRNTSRGDIRNHNKGGHPRHQQYNPWASWERPPPQQQYRSGAPHQRRQQHRGGDQSHWHQRRMC